MKIKLMIAAVIACLVFTGFTKENVSDTVDHNAWKTTGVVVIQNDVLTLAGSNARALLNDGKGYTNFVLDMDVRTTPSFAYGSMISGGTGVLFAMQTSMTPGPACSRMART